MYQCKYVCMYINTYVLLYYQINIVYVCVCVCIIRHILYWVCMDVRLFIFLFMRLYWYRWTKWYLCMHTYLQTYCIVYVRVPVCIRIFKQQLNNSFHFVLLRRRPFSSRLFCFISSKWKTNCWRPPPHPCLHRNSTQPTGDNSNSTSTVNYGQSNSNSNKRKTHEPRITSLV